MSNALPQFRQSSMNTLERLQQQGQSQKQMLEEKVRGEMSVNQLRDLAEQTGLKAKTDLGQSISMGGVEIHSIYGALKNKDLLKKMADARDQFRKRFSKEGDEEEPELEPEETRPERPIGEIDYSEYQEPEVENPAIFTESGDLDLSPEGLAQPQTIQTEYKSSVRDPDPEAPESISETSFGETPATTELGAIEGGAETEETSSGLLSGLGDALSGVGEAVGGVLDTASEVLGPLGVLTGLGFGIYDEIEEQKQHAQETQQANKTQAELNELSNKPTFSSGSRAMPSFDTSQFRSGSLMNF